MRLAAYFVNKDFWVIGTIWNNGVWEEIIVKILILND